MLVADLINNFAQKKTEHDEDYPVSHDDSEIHAERNGNLERHEASKIEDRAQCRRCLEILETRRNLWRQWSYFAGITDKRKKQAEQRISKRFIMYVPGVHKVASKNTQKACRCRN